MLVVDSLAFKIWLVIFSDNAQIHAMILNKLLFSIPKRTFQVNRYISRGNFKTKIYEMDGPPPLTFKIDSSEFKSILSDDLLDLYRVFTKHNYQLRINGGAVRAVLCCLYRCII